MRDPQKAGDIVDEFISKLFPNINNPVMEIIRHWKVIVGDELSEHSKLQDVVNDKLTIAVDHPAWINFGMLKKNEIINKVHKHTGIRYNQIDFLLMY